MKTIILILLLTIGMLSISNAQIVNIPDANFKAALLAYNSPVIDTNGDGEIQVSEAVAFTSELILTNKHISDLTGIEEFINISSLLCDGNQLTSLDISSNTALIELYCGDNQLTSLDLSNNTALTWLDCGNIQLTSLDLSNNTALTWLGCDQNQLTSLDLSSNNALAFLYCSENQLTSLDISAKTELINFYCEQNQLTSLDLSNNTKISELRCGQNQLTSLDLSNDTALTWLDCDNNQLTSLNLRNGNNSIINYIYLINNYNLTCIQVDDSVYSSDHWNLLPNNQYYSENCFYESVEEPNSVTEFSLYPNPSTSNVQLTMCNKQLGSKIEIVDINGKLVLSVIARETKQSLDVSGLAKGVYFVKLITASGVSTQKLILE